MRQFNVSAKLEFQQKTGKGFSAIDYLHHTKALYSKPIVPILYKGVKYFQTLLKWGDKVFFDLVDVSCKVKCHCFVMFKVVKGKETGKRLFDLFIFLPLT